MGDDSISRMDYARLVCEVFDLDSSLLREAEPPESDLFPGAVPVDTSLSNKETKRALGLGPTPLRQLLVDLRTELDTGKISFITKPEK